MSSNNPRGFNQQQNINRRELSFNVVGVGKQNSNTSTNTTSNGGSSSPTTNSTTNNVVTSTTNSKPSNTSPKSSKSSSSSANSTSSQRQANNAPIKSSTPLTKQSSGTQLTTRSGVESSSSSAAISKRLTSAATTVSSTTSNSIKSTSSSIALSSASSSSNLLQTVLSKEEEAELIKELCGEEMYLLLISSKHQEREEFLTRLNVWINQSSNLPHGFMIFPSVNLPIEKTRVLKVLAIILRMTLVDKIIKIVQLAYSTCILLVESAPVQQAKNITHLKEGLSQILPLLMTKVIDSNERNSKSAIQAVTKMSTVKVISKLVFNYALLSINSGKPLSPKAIQGRISLVESLVLKHGLNNSSLEVSIQFLDFLNECLTHKTVQVKDSCIELLAIMHKSMGKELFDLNVMDKLPSKTSTLVQKLEIKIRAKKQEEIEEEKKKEELKNQKTQNETNIVFKQGDISRELIMKKSLKKIQSGESIRSFLKSLTHLHFDSCNISKIINLEHCPNLRVLYLYDNRITKIEGLNNNKQLIHLHLHHNLIEKIEGLDELVNLQQLYLNNNRIKIVENLTKLQKLQELHLQQQDIENSMILDSDSMKSLSNSLTLLDLSNNKIEDSLSIGFLENLIELDLSKNRIDKMDQILFILESNRQLHSLNLIGNSVCDSYKMRDQIIVSSSSDLTLLNQVEITDIQREFLLSFEHQKLKRTSSDNNGMNLALHNNRQTNSNENDPNFLKDLLTIN
ncbi:predicted protein [Naegleria gruberi]|uniref:Predicted protein n=1 Tax=Naegleria gruberi TaxID=5762 RepID=D2V0K7_NAEGR|nr:uncharacterized protein NAEGRDRAFT_45719 [Naegleria gruberi]EFC49539.1 predicted protein [Naegleria gruberi]|eukprot:XP_002682283.1 predicted protein [Naegleria gruberi strain NEG-M]